MKKILFKGAVLLFAGSLLTTSCIGSFSLFNNYAAWQKDMSHSKFVNAVVGFILMPIASPICILVDSLVLNSIEFWTGTNPVADNGTQKVLGRDGRYYAIKTTKHGYKVTDDQGKVTVFTHNAKTDSWSITQNGETRELFRYTQEGTIEATLSSGKTITVTQDEAGLQHVRQAVWADNCYAMY